MQIIRAILSKHQFCLWFSSDNTAMFAVHRQSCKQDERSPRCYFLTLCLIWFWNEKDFEMRRIVVIGPSGSGKSTLARQLSKILDLPHYELDALFWLPGWVQKDRQDFHQEVDDLSRQPGWVICGNYSKLRDILWTRADTIIWLDYSFWRVFSRLFLRTLKRASSGEEMWETGNRETFRKAFFSRESIILWMITSFYPKRREYTALLSAPDYAHAHFMRFSGPARLERFLNILRHRDVVKEISGEKFQV